MTRRWQRVGAVVAIALAALAAIAIRVVVEGRDALADGDAALTAQRPLDAIAAWERAARWYLPAAPHVDEAYTRLKDLAKVEPAVDILAWRAVRSAALASRTLWTPHADDLAEANAAIAQISAKDPEGSLASGKTLPDRIAWHQARLDRDPRPRTLGVALSIVGIVAWLVGLAVVFRRALDAAGKPDRRRIVLGAGIALAGAVAWIAGLYNA